MTTTGIRWNAIRFIATLAGVVLCAGVVAGCSGDSRSSAGDCGFLRDHPHRPGELWEARGCADPEAVLVVVRDSQTEKCWPDSYSRSTYKKNGRRGHRDTYYRCYQLNARTGDCINDPTLRYAHFPRLRKVACSTKGAWRVTDRVDRYDRAACGPGADSASLGGGIIGNTLYLAQRRPDVTFCFERT